MKPTLSIKSEFKDPKEIENIIVTSASGAKLFIKDFATVVDGFKEQESYSSSNGKNVITLNVVKRSGENLIDAADKIEEIIADMKKSMNFLKDLILQSVAIKVIKQNLH
jgi:multidrug efflux pump